MRHVVGLVLFLTLMIGVAPAQDASGPDAGLPDDFERLIPRGYIPSIDDPRFVTADEAEITDDAWVLGVAIGDQAKAYSLNLLNRHEVVNDRVGDRPIAAVW